MWSGFQGRRPRNWKTIEETDLNNLGESGRFSWLEHCRVNQRITDSIPSQDTYWVEPVNVSHIDVSSLPSSL